MDSSGNMSAATDADGTTINYAANVLSVVAPTSATITATTYTVPTSNLNNTSFFNCVSNAIAATMPTPVGISGRVYRLKKTDTTLNAVTITTAAGTIINNGAAITPTANTPGEEWELVSDGTNWQVTNHKCNTAPTAYVPGVTGAVISSSNLYTWRLGRFLFGQGLIAFTSTAGGTGTINIGFGGTSGNVNIDLSITGASAIVCGYYSTSLAGQNSQSPMMIVNQNTLLGFVYPTVNYSAHTGVDLAPFNTMAGAGNYMTMEFKVPISGWFD